MTDRQKIFIDNYIKNGFHSTKAAIDAGYKKNSAHVTASNMLNHPKIKAEISRRIKSMMNETEISSLNLLKTLDDIIDADIGDYIEVEEKEIKEGVTTQNVKIKDLSKLNTKAISEIYQTAYGIKLKFYDKDKAMDLKGRYLKLWENGVVIKDPENEAEKLTREERREKILELRRKLGKSN